MATLPWQHATPERNIDIASARLELDSAHHGLEKVKQRIVEFLAVRQLRFDLSIALFAVGCVACDWWVR